MLSPADARQRVNDAIDEDDQEIPTQLLEIVHSDEHRKAAWTLDDGRPKEEHRMEEFMALLMEVSLLFRLLPDFQSLTCVVVCQ
jgi:hypothetical protein